jgi:hypothetical protein
VSPKQIDLPTVFDQLKGIMDPFAADLVVVQDTPENFYLDSPVQQKKKNVFFGAVQTRKNYVSYHLMPVYIFPELLEDVSEGLKQRLQGKSCFNFTAVDEPLLDELARLTQRGFERYKQENLV